MATMKFTRISFTISIFPREAKQLRYFENAFVVDWWIVWFGRIGCAHKECHRYHSKVFIKQMHELRLQTHNLSNYERTTHCRRLHSFPQEQWGEREKTCQAFWYPFQTVVSCVWRSEREEEAKQKHLNLMPTRLRTRMRKIASGRSGSTRNDTLYLQSADTGPKNRNAKLRKNTSLWSMVSQRSILANPKTSKKHKQFQ